MVLVDANVLLDVLTRDPAWMPWSEGEMRRLSSIERLAVNPIIYAEVSAGYQSAARLYAALGHMLIERLELPYSAAFDAGQAHAAYRRLGGDKRAPMPDFYIGAHALVAGMSLLTRDVGRYRTYFPSVSLIHPASA
jgi:hypothetical protein